MAWKFAFPDIITPPHDTLCAKDAAPLNSSKLFAAVATVLFACTLGVLVAVGAFGVIKMCASMLEGLDVLPIRWSENNLPMMLEISGVAAIPVMIWFLAWFFKRAAAAEAALSDYTYSPPSGKN
ncbi:MAG: hypothetical protein KDE14_12440 [Rhodobacteraceae bacterium]|nr:hypothetical protein [Paracoccaceae bacterium]